MRLFKKRKKVTRIVLRCFHSDLANQTLVLDVLYSGTVEEVAQKFLADVLQGYKEDPDSFLSLTTNGESVRFIRKKDILSPGFIVETMPCYIGE